MYRPPSSKCEWFYLYEKHVEIITSTSNNVIIIDDFNVDENKNSNLKNVMITHGLFQIIKEATRRTKDYSTPPPPPLTISVSKPGDICKYGVIHMV